MSTETNEDYRAWVPMRIFAAVMLGLGIGHCIDTGEWKAVALMAAFCFSLLRDS